MNENKPSSSDEAWTSHRLQMVENQIVRRQVKDPAVIEAMRKVPRHLFVPPEYQDSSYHDGPLPIGYEQTISQPYVVASMTEELKLQPENRVLEIGTGCGYQTAVLAEITCEVFTIEIIPQLAQKAQKLLGKLGYKNIHFRHGDGSTGWPEKAPFDAIIVTAAAPVIPPAFIQQLKYGGRMVIPVERGMFGSQDLILIIKDYDRVKETSLYPVRFVPLITRDED
ncbi:MAG: protein-L-isoaspartate(D-aspartate) O-methyltransferase [candidate division Zixibacteria bacterium]|nr:protein-L-isoaspartate(D-aspartate) O-methyltransferase [candidate division Zixibacteria bacterium]MDD5426486.1 protein-L-isoaspartate(D-aspartate) O-methyltransferase [candidate division Zixibacteria bacterium]